MALEEYDCGTYSAGNYSEVCASAPANDGAPLLDGVSEPGVSEEPAEESNDGQVIILSDIEGYNSDDGVILDLAVGDVIKFTVDGEPHTVTIKVVHDDYVIVTIASTPQDVRVNLGQTIEYDVNDDTIPDVTIRYMSRTALGAGLNVRLLAVMQDPPAQSNQWWGLGIISIIVIITVTILIVKFRKGKV